MSIKVTFNKTTKATKKYELALTEDTEINTNSDCFKYLTLAAVELEKDFTLKELLDEALKQGFTTKSKEPITMVQWHRKGLIEQGVIREVA